MPPIPEGLGVKRDPSGRGLLVSWWGVHVARVDSAPPPAPPGALVVTAEGASSAFTSEGIGTLNGWLPVASPEELTAALGEPPPPPPDPNLHTTCWCGQTINRRSTEEPWQHREPLGHEARPA